MKGGWGRWVRGVEVIDTTSTSRSRSASASATALSSLKTSTRAPASRLPDASKLLPVASVTPARVSTVASKGAPPPSVAVTSNHVAEVKAMRSRSRSQTRRIATDWTRPADRALSTARQRTGETS